MNPAETAAILRQFNEWRRGDEDIPQFDPRKLGEAIDAAVKMIERLEVAEKERERARANYNHVVRILTGIHALLYPPRFTDHDGRTWQFKSPIAEEQMQELSDRIRALPDEIDAELRARGES